VGDSIELERFEALLLELLASDLDAAEVKRRLAASEHAKPFAAYVASLDLRCVEVAQRITKKFAVRDA
jgi:hypothetical protein